MGDALYMKCKWCHLFVEENSDAFDGDGNRITEPFLLAEWVHLHRGTPEDEALDEAHEAEPSGQAHPLTHWKQHGPSAMRKRFEEE